MINPTELTDAAPPERGSKGLIFLAGAIKYWWLKKCSSMNCTWMGETDAEHCPACGTHLYELWGGPEHTEYVEWRDRVRRALIENGYLTYAPHEAFKGTWDDKAQAVNDAAIIVSTVVLNLSPKGIPTVGTDDEVTYARRVKTPVLLAPPGSRMDLLLKHIEAYASILAL